MTKVEDEFGQVWWVGSGDPAERAVKLLHAGHYTWLVLPRSLITTGVVPDVPTTLHLVRRMRYNRQGDTKQHMRLLECVGLLWRAKDAKK